jgi:hypothetical protein
MKIGIPFALQRQEHLFSLDSQKPNAVPLYKCVHLHDSILREHLQQIKLRRDDAPTNKSLFTILLPLKTPSNRLTQPVRILCGTDIAYSYTIWRLTFIQVRLTHKNPGSSPFLCFLPYFRNVQCMK